jgi:hypothetical protein
MSREMVQTAAKLLAKAQSTTSDHEAIALVERSYALLAQVINAYDLEHDNPNSGARRRERRRLYERRRRARADAAGGGQVDGGVEPPARTVDSIARYRGAGSDGGYSRRRGIDVRL